MIYINLIQGYVLVGFALDNSNFNCRLHTILLNNLFKFHIAEVKILKATSENTGDKQYFVLVDINCIETYKSFLYQMIIGYFKGFISTFQGSYRTKAFPVGEIVAEMNLF